MKDSNQDLELYARAKARGADWARALAMPQELQRLAELQARGIDYLDLLASTRLYAAIKGESLEAACARDHEAESKFWRRVIGEDAGEIFIMPNGRAPALKGFVAGALAARPFSLTCRKCDAGMGVASFADAMRAGWVEIISDPDGLGWNQVGLCPDCQSGCQ